MRQALLSGLLMLLALAMVSCYDDEEDYTYKTENCAVITAVDGQRYTACCRLKCIAEYDDGDYRERCVEETTCTTASGASCPPSVLVDNRAPACFY
jgi:hypothetical protein